MSWLNKEQLKNLENKNKIQWVWGSRGDSDYGGNIKNADYSMRFFDQKIKKIVHTKTYNICIMAWTAIREIFINAVDFGTTTRHQGNPDEFVKNIYIEFDYEKNICMIKNDGLGMNIGKKTTENYPDGIYFPQTVYGDVRWSTNFDDSKI